MLLTVTDVVKTYRARRGRGAEPTVAIDHITLAVDEGETLGVVGESGSGKSTLGRIVAALEVVDGGRVQFEGIEVSALRGERLRRARRGFQVVFQDPASSLDRRMTIGELLTEPLVIHDIGSAEERRAAVLEMIDRVGLQPSVVDAYPHEVSGGQRQRAAIARALMLSPRLVVADEPTSALDVSIQAHVLTLLQELQKQFSLSYIFISHDLSVVRYMSDRIAVMHQGRLVELGDAAAVYDTPAHPYTRELLDATDGNPVLAATAGEEAVHGRTGCLYRARCPLADAVCATTTPPLRPVAEGRSVACHHPLVRVTIDAAP